MRGSGHEPLGGVGWGSPRRLAQLRNEIVRGPGAGAACTPRRITHLWEASWVLASFREGHGDPEGLRGQPRVTQQRREGWQFFLGWSPGFSFLGPHSLPALDKCLGAPCPSPTETEGELLPWGASGQVGAAC